MPSHKAFTLTMTAPSANGICLSQKPVAVGVQNLLLNGALVSGGVATLDTNMRGVAITSDANDSGRTFTIVGKDYNGQTITETITGPNTTSVNSVNYFLTVTSITVDNATTGNITVGTNATAASKWYPANYLRFPATSFICDISTGAVLNYTVQITGDNLQTSASMSYLAKAQPLAGLTNMTTSDSGNVVTGIGGVRIVLNSWTSGSVTMNIISTAATVG